MRKGKQECTSGEIRGERGIKKQTKENMMMVLMTHEKEKKNLSEVWRDVSASLVPPWRPM